MITFAVVGHNEAATLGNMLAQVREMARPGDRVWFVDSASTDSSAALAAELGAEVVRGELGKGRAMAAAVERCETSHICFLDADLRSSTRNIPLALREALERSGADMAVAEFHWVGKGVVSNTIGVWRPIAGDLFPEALGVSPSFPLSGFRLLDLELACGSLPPGYGIEAHLNVVGTLDGRRTVNVDVGELESVPRPHPTLSRDIADALFDLAEAHGRLDRAVRPLWEEWVDEVAAVIETRPPKGSDETEYRERLEAVARRPRPQRSAAAA
jgi:glucosyl-3-phosphoglycerate synthase